MLTNKKAQLGGGITLFFTTIIILFILITFVLSNYIIRSFYDIKSGTESIELLEINSYMRDFKNFFEKRVTLIHDEEICKPAEEVYNKYLGRCICNAERGWTNQENPWRSFEPPCIHRNQLDTLYAVDRSLTLGEKSDKGVCIGYYSLRYVILLLNNEPIKDIIDLVEYEFLDGYVNKVDDKFMDRFLKDDIIKGQYNIKERRECIGYDHSYRARNYVVFYDSYLDNLNKGNIDDVGYCAGFSKTRELNPFLKTTRKNCKLIDESDPTYDYSFFVSQKGSLTVFSSELFKENVILETFFPVFNIEESPKEFFSEKEIMELCPDYYKYNLVFIRGIQDLVEEIESEELDSLYRRRAHSACSRAWQHLRSIAHENKEDHLDGPYRFDYYIIDKLKGDFCCYGKKL